MHWAIWLEYKRSNCLATRTYIGHFPLNYRFRVADREPSLKIKGALFDEKFPENLLNLPRDTSKTAVFSMLYHRFPSVIH